MFYNNFKKIPDFFSVKNELQNISNCHRDAQLGVHSISVFPKAQGWNLKNKIFPLFYKQNKGKGNN